MLNSTPPPEEPPAKGNLPATNNRLYPSPKYTCMFRLNAQERAEDFFATLVRFSWDSPLIQIAVSPDRFLLVNFNADLNENQYILEQMLNREVLPIERSQEIIWRELCRNTGEES